MSAIRRQKIEKLIEYTKTIEPKLREQITTEMQQEIDQDPYLSELTEKPEIDKTELTERLKDAMHQELWQYALKEFPENNKKTLKEYTQRAMMQK